MIAKIVTGEIEDIATDYGKNAAAVALGRMGGKARAAQWSTAYRRTMLPGTVLEDVMIQWFDDLTVGMRYKGGEAEVTREDIKRFAAEFDPQPFHLDEAAAEKSMFKGLAASGW